MYDKRSTQKLSYLIGYMITLTLSGSALYVSVLMQLISAYLSSANAHVRDIATMIYPHVVLHNFILLSHNVNSWQ